MKEQPRYAIYFVPQPESDLYRLGSRLLGYDCYDRGPVQHPSGTPEDWHVITAAPRRYGFHATLKAPFRLRSEFDERQLVRGVDAFVKKPRPVPTVGLSVRFLGGFIALVPERRDDALDQLAGDCMMDFDRFRAPATAAERERRIASGLSDRQREYLERWDYPYVFEDFRFHMTLTGEVWSDRRASIVQWLAGMFERCAGLGAVTVDRIVLLRQDSFDRNFKVIHQRTLLQP